jgi:hypothetical protein
MNRHGLIAGAVVVALLVGMVLAGTALAQGPAGDGNGVRSPVGGAYGPAYGFVDTDGDGINDRYQSCDCGAVCVGAGNSYRFAPREHSQVGGNGEMLQMRSQQQDCEGDCTQDRAGEQMQTRSRDGDQLQTRTRDGSGDGQGTASAGAGSGSSQKGGRGR